MTFTNGDRYDGGFLNSAFEGFGSYLFGVDGSKQCGTYKDGMLTGTGREIRPTGVYYSGGYFRGRRYGPGMTSVPGAGVTITLNSEREKKQGNIEQTTSFPVTTPKCPNALRFGYDGSVTLSSNLSSD